MEAVDFLSVVLGLLDEWMGHSYDSDDDIVECFYPAQGELAKEFCACLVRLAEQRGISTTVRSMTSESGHIRIYSRELADLISSCYRDRRASGYLGRNQERLYLDAEFFRDASVGKTLSFLAGAYARFGDGATFVYANAPHKAELTRLLLESAAGPGVTVSTNEGYVRRADTVSFAAFPELVVRLTLLYESGLSVREPGSR
jgi:hypothetical protein